MALNINDTLKIIENLYPSLDFEIIPIEETINRISAENIFANCSLPKFDNSAMDGYAILFDDRNNELDVIDTIFAGDNTNITLNKNCCVKIMTGAKIPSNATAIIPKEETKLLNNNKIKIKNKIKVKEFQHIKFIGEDISLNEKLINIGDRINFSKITLLSSQGISHLKVYKKPKIAVFASGEELKLHYEKIEDYQIYNSNTPTFIARAKELGCEVTFMGQAKDSVESIKELINNSLNADLIITSGGVSVGDADFTKEAFQTLDFDTIIDGIIIKPGKPTIFGKIKNTYILNLPGNPLASALIFELFGRLIIQKLIGSNNLYHNFILGKLSNKLEIKKGKYTIIPGMFDGEYFHVIEKRSPGMVNVLSKANSMIVLDDEIEKLPKDYMLKILPINWKFFTDIKKDFITK
ncbi:molybdopterin molybdenumtransferase MoeA [Malaciobacter molluscorum LMG 25693]|uniref:Molybdopterin molybdenumtransferase n=1 Tax=Malaciobacter molluscorum LMG 25693 TaxID=870501 RepID=A0A2G1DK36_9BACT|nr:molybdopterin molybdotransferase MoeA [Malaciobacter molluscorum]AXX91354.1 molybdopterin molybdenumtransferase [Malaciobacter molluscorum LMG 25693]PHO18893.1 molybdopterin molybdenumtransferase MoeA [Malaciobacter molluscorum LMG 25693]RXJ94356.1 molybdopterin molybdenumtransferase MoeA [Malaciobacter molluscorum]